MSDAATDTSCFRRHVHQRDRLTQRHQEFACLTCGNEILGEAAVRGSVTAGSLCDRVLGLLHRRQIDDVVGDLAVDDLAITASPMKPYLLTRLNEARLLDQDRCSGLPAFRSGRCDRSASDERPEPRSPHVRG